jgi:hypothetical protein
VLNKLAKAGFEIQCRSHAAAILEKDAPLALEDLEQALLNLTVPIKEIVGSGGGETKLTQRIRRAFTELGWAKTIFEIRKTINGVERESVSHEVDHVKVFSGYSIALEIEWNNKDPFFDRDLENFKRLHVEGAISVGVVVTRGSSLHNRMREFILNFANAEKIGGFGDLERLNIHPTPRQTRDIEKRAGRTKSPIDFASAWVDTFVSDKYGEATTHWKKLEVRVARGVGNPCPLLLIGLPASIVTLDGEV